MLAKSRLIVGISCLVVSALIFLLGRGRYPTAGGVAFAVLGIIMVSISRRK
jgi:hypothetical protein